MNLSAAKKMNKEESIMFILSDGSEKSTEEIWKGIEENSDKCRLPSSRNVEASIESTCGTLVKRGLITKRVSSDKIFYRIVPGDVRERDIFDDLQYNIGENRCTVLPYPLSDNINIPLPAIGYRKKVMIDEVKRMISITARYLKVLEEYANYLEDSISDNEDVILFSNRCN
jgi:hypothetical protein